MVEISLRAGDVNSANVLVKALEERYGDMRPSLQAEFKYLKGEMARQSSDIKTTTKYWKKLIKKKLQLLL